MDSITITPEQIFGLSLISTILVQTFRFIIEQLRRKEIKSPRWVWVTIVYVVSFAVGVLWFPQGLPTLPIVIGDPVLDSMVVIDYLARLLALLTFYVILAVKIYDYLIKPVKDSIAGIEELKTR